MDELTELFARLDALLVPALRSVQGAGGEADPVLGAYISERQVERLMAAPPGTSPLWLIPRERLAARLPGPLRPESRLGRLRDAFGLDETDLGLVAVALAPEVDVRYERLYAYLQDDATRRWPSVDLALDLLSGSAGAKLEARRRLAAEAPLLRNRLARIHQSEPGQALLSCRLSLDRQAVDFLLGHDGLDERLTAFVDVMASEPPATPPGEREARLLALASAADRRPPLLHFHGGQGAGKRTAAGRLATMAGMPLLCVDLARAPADDAGFDAAMSLVAARCWLHPCLLYLDHADAIPDAPEGARWRAVAAVLAAQRGVTVLASQAPLAAERRGSVPGGRCGGSGWPRSDCARATMSWTAWPNCSS